NGPKPGDFDMDGDIDGADFVAWQTNFPSASNALPFHGDADFDGDVDGEDYIIMITSVPEPTTAVLAAISLTSLIAVRLRQSPFQSRHRQWPSQPSKPA